MMKKIALVLAVLAVVQSASAISDIGFSNAKGGYWSYVAEAQATKPGEGVFSFVQPITVDNVLGGITDKLVGNFVFLPDLYVSNLTEIFGGSNIYTGTLTPVNSTIALKDINGNDILTGTLTVGGLFTIGSSGSMYPSLDLDIQIVTLDKNFGSDYISGLDESYGFKFDLTLNDSSLNLAKMILSNTSHKQGSTLSGSMTAVVPEPATMVILALGSLLLRKRK